MKRTTSSARRSFRSTGCSPARVPIVSRVTSFQCSALDGSQPPGIAQSPSEVVERSMPTTVSTLHPLDGLFVDGALEEAFGRCLQCVGEIDDTIFQVAAWVRFDDGACGRDVLGTRTHQRLPDFGFFCRRL